jgi:hypothetical protein
MRIGLFYLLFAAECFGQESANNLWAAVPESREARRLEVFSVAGAQSEALVRLVGSSAHLPGTREETPVVGFGVSLGADPIIEQTLPAFENSVIPAEALWPGPDGRIATPPVATAIPTSNHGMRNPWEIRTRGRVAQRDSAFLCGGVIAGGDFGPVALLNGRVVKRNISVDGFEVMGIFPTAVVLRREGTIFVAPLGRRITIVTPEY